MRRIEIDEDVYAELETHVKGFEQPNDVLRRILLGEDARTRPSARPTAGRRGRLSHLLEAGLIEVGDPLSHIRPRKGEKYQATVAEAGWIRTDNGLYSAPSPALGELVGSQIDGWHSWLHVPSGKTLRQLRDQASGQ